MMKAKRTRRLALCVLACAGLWQAGCDGMMESHPVESELATATGTPAQQPNTAAPPAADPNLPAADLRAFYGMPRCAASQLAVCDSFEASGSGAALDANVWTVEVSGVEAQIALDTHRAARGSGSVHVHVSQGGYRHAMLVHKKLFPVANNTFFGRAFVYLDGAAPQEHFTLFSASGTLPEASAPTYVRYGGELGLLAANYVGNGQMQHAGAPMADGSWIDTTAVPTGRWTCMEWEFKGDTNEMHFWLDGVDVPRLAVVGQSNECCKGQVWTAPPYDRVALGWEAYKTAQDATQTGYDLWLDEIALDTQRIGCTR